MKQNPFQQVQAIPSREAAHGEQVACLLAIAANLQAYLLFPHREFEPHKQPPELDGGALASAATTFMGVCKRLDDILADGSRWNLENHNQLYDELVKSQKANQEFLESQTRAAESIIKPSYQLRPTILQIGDRYAAIFGEINNPQVVGVGATPELALQDFDSAFKRTPAEQLKAISAENDRQQELQPQQPTKKGKKK